MIPFSGFMQAVSGCTSAFGSKTLGHGKGIPGLSDTGLPVDDVAGSFLEWVHKLMDNQTPAGTDGERVFLPQDSQSVSGPHDIDAFPPKAAEDMEPASAGQHLPFPTNAESLGQWPNPVPPGANGSIIVTDNSRQAVGMHARGGEQNPGSPGANGAIIVPDNSSPAVGSHARGEEQNPVPPGANDAIMDPGDSSPAVGSHARDTGRNPVPSGTTSATIAPDDGRYSAEKDARQAFSAVQEMPVEKEKPSVVGPNQPAADDQPSPAKLSGIPAQSGPTDQDQIKASPLKWVKQENVPKDGPEKEAAPPSFKPVSPATDALRDNTYRIRQEPLTAESGTMTPAIDPALHRHTKAGQTKAPEFMASAIIDPKEASSADNPAEFQGKDKHAPTQRSAMTDLNENELTKDQSLDAVKGSVPETTKPHPSYQEAAKAMAVEPSTTAADKPNAGLAAASTRAEASAAGTFQATVMDQIVDKATMRSIHGRSEIQIRLKPEFLGNVHMNIATDKEQLVVRIIADQPAVKEIIETHLHHLRTELQNQGLTIDKIEVMVNPDADHHQGRDQFAQMFKQHSFQNDRRLPQDKHPDEWNRGDGNESDDDPAKREGVNYFA